MQSQLASLVLVDVLGAGAGSGVSGEPPASLSSHMFDLKHEAVKYGLKGQWSQGSRGSRNRNRALGPMCRLWWMSEIIEGANLGGRIKLLFRQSHPSFVCVAPLLRNLVLSSS